jgi:transcriptional regulator with XRE-family HTH domain
MKERDLRELGKLIRKHRVEREMRLRDVEKITDIAASMLSRLEQGEGAPNPLYLLRLAEALQVPAADYYRLAGILPPEALPDLQRYLCDKYGLTGDQAERIKEIAQALAGTWGKVIE